MRSFRDSAIALRRVAQHVLSPGQMFTEANRFQHEMERAKSAYAAARDEFHAAAEKGDQAAIKRTSNQVSTSLVEFGRAKFRYEEAVRAT